MACQVILEFDIKPECMEQLGVWIAHTLPATRNFEGCVNVTVAQNQDRPAEVIIVQHWISRQRYIEFLDWRKQTGVFSALLAMINSEPRLRFFDYFAV